jgi:Na+/H+ antiporter NhaD/arsenite permease-like protein
MGLHLARSVDVHPVLMYVLLPMLTAGIASLLDIVTVALFIVPLTVEVFDGLGIDPLLLRSWPRTLEESRLW